LRFLYDFEIVFREYYNFDMTAGAFLKSFEEKGTNYYMMKLAFYPM
jgi:hypothetical protein